MLSSSPQRFRLYPVLFFFCLFGSLSWSQGGIHIAGNADNPYEPNHREDDLLKGPVREMKLEIAFFQFGMTGWVEGVKRPVSVVQYDADGILSMKDTYNSTSGQWEEHIVNQRNGQGYSGILSTYLPEQLANTIEYVYDAQGVLKESLRKDSAGTLQERTAFTWNGGILSEIATYDAKGTLRLKQLMNNPLGEVETFLYKADGSLEGRTVFKRTGLKTETTHYDGSGTMISRGVITEKELGIPLRSEQYDGNNQLTVTSRYQYEGEDAYGNWLKKITYLVPEIPGDLGELPDGIDIGFMEIPTTAESRTFRFLTGVEEFELY